MATLKQVSNEIIGDLSKIDKLPRFIGAALQSEMLDRIFTKGKASDGSKIGEYSIFTIALKKNEGKFTSKDVNLRNTDTLANSYIFDATNKGVELGFTGGSRTDNKTGETVINADLVPKLEEKYGDIFALTSEEEKLIEDLTEDFTDKIFK